MPARRKGSGFTRRKKKPAGSQQQQQQASSSKKQASNSKNPSPKKTPAPAKRTSKRQQLALSLPRRTSPRIAALARKKMMENGLLIDTEPEPEPEETQVQQRREPEHDLHVQDHLVLTNSDVEVEVATTEVLVVNQGPVVTTTATATATAVQQHGSQQYHRRARREPATHHPSPPRAEAAAEVGAATDVAAVYFDDEEEQPPVEEDEVGAPSSGLEDLQQLPPRQIVIDVEASLKEVDEDFVSHAVLLHFGRTSGWKVTPDLALQWITANVGDRDTIGAIRYCRDLGRSFFSVYFELAIGRRRALAYRSPSKGIVVSVFPWCADMLDSCGRELSPRMIALPGLVDNLVPLLPSIGASLGTFVGALGVLAPDADIEAVREQTGWASACSGGGGASEPPPRVVVMMRSGESVPASIKLKLRDGVYKTLQLYEQLPSGMKRKAGNIGSPMTAQRLSASKKRLKS